MSKNHFHEFWPGQTWKNSHIIFYVRDFNSARRRVKLLSYQRQISKMPTPRVSSKKSPGKFQYFFLLVTYFQFFNNLKIVIPLKCYSKEMPHLPLPQHAANCASTNVRKNVFLTFFRCMGNLQQNKSSFKSCRQLEHLYQVEDVYNLIWK